MQNLGLDKLSYVTKPWKWRLIQLTLQRLLLHVSNIVKCFTGSRYNCIMCTFFHKPFLISEIHVAWGCPYMYLEQTADSLIFYHFVLAKDIRMLIMYVKYPCYDATKIALWTTWVLSNRLMQAQQTETAHLPQASVILCSIAAISCDA